MLGGQAQRPATPHGWLKQWDRNTGRITISLPKAKISATSSQRVSTSLMRLQNAEIETEGMTLTAEEVELRTDTMEANIRGARLKLER